MGSENTDRLAWLEGVAQGHNDRFEALERKIAAAQETAKQMHAEKDARLAQLEARMRPRSPFDEGARGLTCPCCSKVLSLCARHGLYVRTDENQCPACRRGE